MSETNDRPRDSGLHLALKRGLLLCGPASTALYIGLDTIAARRYEGYRYTDQTISELSAVDAPTRPLWLPVAFVYSLLTIAFSFGVWLTAGASRALRVVAVMAGAVGLVGLFAWPFAPMHRREVLAEGGGTRSDTIHLSLGALDGVLFATSAAFGAMALGKRFRLYSLATLLLLLGFGTSMGADSPKVGRNEPTPWLGIKERILVFSSMIWMAVLGIALLRSPGTTTTRRVMDAADLVAAFRGSPQPEDPMGDGTHFPRRS